MSLPKFHVEGMRVDVATVYEGSMSGRYSRSPSAVPPSFGFGDVVDERVDVYLYHCISLVVGEERVGGIGGVESAGEFPGVGHAVAVGIERRFRRV